MSFTTGITEICSVSIKCSDVYNCGCWTGSSLVAAERVPLWSSFARMYGIHVGRHLSPCELLNKVPLVLRISSRKGWGRFIGIRVYNEQV